MGLAGPVIADNHAECISEVHNLYAGEFSGRGHSVEYSGGMSTFESDFGAEMSEPGVLNYTYDGAVSDRWVLNDGVMTMVSLGEDGQDEHDPYVVNVPVCEKGDDGMYCIVDEYKTVADRDASEDDSSSKSWDTRHEHWVSDNQTFTAIQVREAGSDGIYRTVSSAISSRKKTER